MLCARSKQNKQVRSKPLELVSRFRFRFTFGDQLSRSVWSGRSLLPLFRGEAISSISKAPASRTHSKRFAIRACRFVHAPPPDLLICGRSESGEWFIEEPAFVRVLP